MALNKRKVFFEAYSLKKHKHYIVYNAVNKRKLKKKPSIPIFTEELTFKTASVIVCWLINIKLSAVIGKFSIIG